MPFYNNILYVIFSYFCESTMTISENLHPDHLLLFLILLNFMMLVYSAYIVLGRGKSPSPSNSQPQSPRHSISPHLPSNQLQSKTTTNPKFNITFSQPPSQPYLHSSQHQDYFSCTQLNNQKFWTSTFTFASEHLPSPSLHFNSKTPTNSITFNLNHGFAPQLEVTFSQLTFLHLYLIQLKFSTYQDYQPSTHKWNNRTFLPSHVKQLQRKVWR